MFDKRNIRIYYLKTLERIRSFLLSRNSREFLIFLFFVFVSFCFWLLQVLMMIMKRNSPFRYG